MKYKKELRIEFLYPDFIPGKYHCGTVQRVKKINLALIPANLPNRAVGFRYYVYLFANVIFNKKKEVLKSKKIYISPNYFVNAQKFTIQEFMNLDNRGTYTKPDSTEELKNQVYGESFSRAIFYCNLPKPINQPKKRECITRVF